MKKIYFLLILLLILASCSSNDNQSTSNENIAKKINVYTRDKSSGSREAFENILKIKAILDDAIETASNGDMVAKVAADEMAIGYASLSTDFEKNGVKAIKFNGVKANSSSILDGSYQIQRPFSFVTRAQGDFESSEKQQLVSAFIDFLTISKEGLEIVKSAGGEVNMENAKPWSELINNHPITKQDNSKFTIKTAGSTSVTKTLKAALEAFSPLAGNVQFILNQTGSSDGYKRVLGAEKSGINAADIGFVSRKFKSEEKIESALAHGVYCLDAVVVIVNPKNEISNLAPDQLLNIYEGKIRDWNDILK